MDAHELGQGYKEILEFLSGDNRVASTGLEQEPHRTSALVATGGLIKIIKLIRLILQILIVKHLIKLLLLIVIIKLLPKKNFA